MSAPVSPAPVPRPHPWRAARRRAIIGSSIAPVRRVPMRRPMNSRRVASLACCAFSAAATVVAAAAAFAPIHAQSSAQRRPLSFLDLQNMQQASAPVLSPDGAWALYTLSVANWKDARRQSDIYLVSTLQGLN